MGLLRPTGVTTETYAYADGFMIDIVRAVSDGVGDMWDVWLYHEDYAYKYYLFSIPMNTEIPATTEMVLEQIEENLKAEDYIDEYKNSFM